MTDLNKAFCFARPNANGTSYASEFSLDGQRFRSPIFTPMNGCAKGQELPAGTCREPQLKACSSSQDPWLWTAGKQGCANSTLCSPLLNPREQFRCKDRTCVACPNPMTGCQAPAFRKTWAGNIVKSNFNLPAIQTLPYRLPPDQIPKSTSSFAWTSVPNIVLMRATEPGFNLTMYNRGKHIL